MEVLRVDEFRKDIYKYIDSIIDTSEPLHIMRKDNKGVVIISDKEWNNIQETLYLYSFGKNYIDSILEAGNTPIEEFIDSSEVDL